MFGMSPEDFAELEKHTAAELKEAKVAIYARLKVVLAHKAAQEDEGDGESRLETAL